MKKILAIVLFAAVVFSGLPACGDSKKDDAADRRPAIPGYE